MFESLFAILREKYNLVKKREIGRGGFGVVFEAEANGVPCAVKVLYDPIEPSSATTIQELKSLHVVKAVSGHPHIVSLFDVWQVEDGQVTRLVTRWELGDMSLEGRLLECRGQGLPGVPHGELLGYMWEAAEALDSLNNQGIYHRDVKPENLLLFRGHLKLADLGLAKFVGATTGRSEDTHVGTLGYMPPELDQAKPHLAETSDLYSLAATYVKLRTGHGAFGDSHREIARRQDAGHPVLEGLDPAEAELVGRALAVQPEERPQEGAVAWVAELDRAVGSSGVRQAAERAGRRHEGQPATGQRPPKKVNATALALLYLVLAVGAVVIGAARQFDSAASIGAAFLGLVPLSLLGLWVAVRSVRARNAAGIVFGISAPAMLAITPAVAHYFVHSLGQDPWKPQGTIGRLFLGYGGVSLLLWAIASFHLLRSQVKASLAVRPEPQGEQDVVVRLQDGGVWFKIPPALPEGAAGAMARGPGWALSWLLCLLYALQILGIAALAVGLRRPTPDDIAVAIAGILVSAVGVLAALLSARARITSGIVFGLSAPLIAGFLWVPYAWGLGVAEWHAFASAGAMLYVVGSAPLGAFATYRLFRARKGRPRWFLGLFLAAMCTLFLAQVTLLWMNRLPRPGDFQESARSPAALPEVETVNNYYSEGNNHFYQDQLDKAIAAYTKAVELQPARLAEALYMRGCAYLLQGNYDQAAVDWNEAIRVNAEFAGAYYRLGQLHAERGDLNEASFALTESIRLNRDGSRTSFPFTFRSADAYAKRGDVYRRLAKYDRAIADFTQALDLGPGNPASVYNGLGLAWAAKADPAMALANYGKAIDLKPDWAVPYVNRGDARADLGRYDEAIADYTDAVEIDPKNVASYVNRGVARSRNGQPDEAIADYTKAIQLDPRSALAYRNRGVVYMQQGRFREAEKDLQRAHDIDPTDSTAWELLEEARRVRAVLPAESTDAVTLDSLIRSLETIGKPPASSNE